MKDQDIKDLMVRYRAAIHSENDQSAIDELTDELAEFETAHWERIITDMEFFEFYMLEFNDALDQVTLHEKLNSGKWDAGIPLETRPGLLIATIKGLLKEINSLRQAAKLQSNTENKYLCFVSIDADKLENAIKEKGYSNTSLSKLIGKNMQYLNDALRKGEIRRHYLEMACLYLNESPANFIVKEECNETNQM